MAARADNLRHLRIHPVGSCVAWGLCLRNVSKVEIRELGSSQAWRHSIPCGCDTTTASLPSSATSTRIGVTRRTTKKRDASSLRLSSILLSRNSYRLFSGMRWWTFLTWTWNERGISGVTTLLLTLRPRMPSVALHSASGTAWFNTHSYAATRNIAF